MRDTVKAQKALLKQSYYLFGPFDVCLRKANTRVLVSGRARIRLALGQSQLLPSTTHDGSREVLAEENRSPDIGHRGNNYP